MEKNSSKKMQVIAMMRHIANPPSRVAFAVPTLCRVVPATGVLLFRP